MRGDLGSSDCRRGICHLSKGEQLCSVRTLDNDLQGGSARVGKDKQSYHASLPMSQQAMCPSPLSVGGKGGWHPAPKGARQGVGGRAVSPTLADLRSRFFVCSLYVRNIQVR